MTDFIESAHPRHLDGKFTHKTNDAPRGGLTASPELTPGFADVWTGAAEDARNAHARAVFSIIAEPADGEMGRAVNAHGATHVLAVLTSDRDDQSAADAIDAPRDKVVLWRQRMRDVPLAFRLAKESGITVHTAAEGGIPDRFADLGDGAPLALWVRGNADILHELGDAVSIAGARAATSYGSYVAAEFAADLAGEGRPIVTTGNYGIAGDALRGSLAAGGRGVVFTAAGPERAYPTGHDGLFDKVVSAGGAVVSETPPGTTATKWRATARQRLIAAASPCTIIVEAGDRSETRIAAAHAREMGRAVGAVPGPVTSAASAGANALIATGEARLVTCTNDIRALAEEGARA